MTNYKDIHTFVNNLISKYGNHRQNLIRILQAIQKEYKYLPRSALELVSSHMNIPLSDILTVATFYHQFTLEKPGIFTIWVCMGTACHLKGNNDNYEYLRRLLGLDNGRETTSDGIFTLKKARCFGCCSLAPVIAITGPHGRDLYGYVTPQKLRGIISKYRVLARRYLEVSKMVIK